MLITNIAAIACLFFLQTAASAPASGPASAPAADAGAAWRELFAQPASGAQPSPAEANQRIDAVLAACGNSVERLKSLIAADDAYADFKPGWHKGPAGLIKVSDGNVTYGVEFLYRVPRGYTPKKAWPLILACHGQGGNGSHIGFSMEQTLGRAVEDYILLAPTMPGPAFYFAKAYQEQAYLRPLAWAMENLRVDGDRVYVTGYSQGGHQSWHLATMFGRHFAAAVPMAGVPAFEGMPYTIYMYLENLSTISMWSIWGEKDVAVKPGDQGNVDVCREAAARLKALGIASFKGTEIPGATHYNSWANGKEFLAFLQAHKRQAAPEKFTHAFHLRTHTRAYWLEATTLARAPIRLDEPIRIPVTTGRPPTTEEALQAGMKVLDKALFRFSAELDRAANRITLRGTDITSYRISLLDGMLDLSKEVTIQVGALPAGAAGTAATSQAGASASPRPSPALPPLQTWRGRVKASPRCLLAHYAADRDAGALVVNELDVSAAGRVTVRYGD